MEVNEITVRLVIMTVLTSLIVIIATYFLGKIALVFAGVIVICVLIRAYIEFTKEGTK